MKDNLKKTVFISITLAIVALAIWWTVSRKTIIKKAVQQTVATKTDSLYKITYDSSYFDEANGNAVLFDVSVKVDSAVLEKMMQYDTIPSIIANVQVKSIAIQGLKSLRLLAGFSIDVEKITLESPRVVLHKLKKPFGDSDKTTANDSVELYKLLLGHFHTIKASQITIHNGSFQYADNQQDKHVNIGLINFSINDFIIDAQHDYALLMDYFIKKAVVHLAQISVRNSMLQPIFTLDSMYYNALGGQLFFNGIAQGPQTVKAVLFKGVNTADFILHKRFSSHLLEVDGMAIQVQQRASSKQQTDLVGIPKNGFLEALNIDSILVRNASLSVQLGGFQTLRMEGIGALATHMQLGTGLFSLKQYLHTKPVDFYVREMMVTPIGDFHSLAVSQMAFNGLQRKITIGKLAFQPRYGKEEAMAKASSAIDLFYVKAKDIAVLDCNVFDGLLNNRFAASSIVGSMDFTIYDDKTLHDTATPKPVQYLQEKVRDAKMNIDVPLIRVVDSKVAYEEKSHDSKMTSRVPFEHVSAIVRNVHNRQNLDRPLAVDIHAMFVGGCALATHWTLPYNAQNGFFNIAGQIGPMDLTALNAFAKPMAMVNVKYGALRQFNFNIDGDRAQTHGVVAVQYDGVKVDMLKLDKETDTLKKRELKSFLGSLLIHKNHGNAKNIEFGYKPRVGDSFFATAWSSIFTGLKKVALR